MKKVTVVVCCYNVADVLMQCWNSLKSQTIGLENMECIFVDDASTDEGKTWNTLKSIESEAPDDVLIIQAEKNGGPGGALNIGISYASGEYLQLMGADDELKPIALETLYRLAEQNKADIVQYNHLMVLGDQSRVNKVSVGNCLYEIQTKEDRVEFLNATKVTYGCTNKFYRTDLVHNTGVRFAENVVYEEPLFVYPLFLYAKRVYLCEEGLYVYHLHDNSIVTSRVGRQLTDHPKVQLMLLYDCMRREELYQEYMDVIALYFLWSYYCETLFFAGEHVGARLPLQVYSEMQRVCRKLYPDWRDNPQIKRVDKATKNLLETIDADINTQEELDKLIRDLKEGTFDN